VFAGRRVHQATEWWVAAATGDHCDQRDRLAAEGVGRLPFRPTTETRLAVLNPIPGRSFSTPDCVPWPSRRFGNLPAFARESRRVPPTACGNLRSMLLDRRDDGALGRSSY
jgi:hypothetical protein